MFLQHVKNHFIGVGATAEVLAEPIATEIQRTMASLEAKHDNYYGKKMIEK
ncbi:MAG: hypothetical protein OXC61_12030 [Flavobacteriaceae bacterium]|nr:hypothetical protein [Flavobacteriaceae bacterium]